MPRLGGFRAQCPEVDLMLHPSVERVALQPGGIELAIRFGKGAWPGFEAALLVETDFVIAGARSLVGDARIEAPEDLLRFPWLQELGTTETNDLLRSYGVTEGRVKSLSQMPGNLLLDGLRQGQGIAATNLTFIEADVARGDIVVLRTDRARGTGYFLVQRPGVLRPAARAFAQWIRREARLGKRAAGRD
jgi:LysR family glycine cleavage system transcriptional activator